MKITIKHNDAELEWDSSMCDDKIEMNQIALDIADGVDTESIIRYYLKRNFELMEYKKWNDKAPEQFEPE